MLLFLSGIAILIIGYFVYGRMVERIIGPDDRQTPAVTSADGVDYVVLPHWKNMLIQLLNIAGVGPVIGVILGIKFGAVVFLIIPIGNLLAGATHDFLSGIMSLRDNGANLPKIIRDNLGHAYGRFFSLFMVGLLLLVVAVFINVPAGLCNGLFLKDVNLFWVWVGIIFAYYIVATLFPVDKIIGTIYPVFGIMLLAGTGAIFAALLFSGLKAPELLQMSDSFRAQMFHAPHAPIIPLLFVTIACGIISGFHASQSPIIARTMKSERQARSTFYGMMVVEGVIAMIWAGAGLAIYNLFPELMTGSPNAALLKITRHFLGSAMGTITVIAVVILAITSGDTALRSARLSLSEMLNVEQKSIRNRILVCLPLIAIVAGLLFWSNRDAKSFGFLWNYFAWGNQVLAASTLMAGAVWLIARKDLQNSLIALIPGMFMVFIVVCYILWTSPAHGQAYGLGLDIRLAECLSLCTVLLAAIFAIGRGMKLRKENRR